MNINRLDGHPHFIVRVLGIIVVLPFVLVRDWWRKRFPRKRGVAPVSIQKVR